MRALPPRSHYGYVPLLGRLPIADDGATGGGAADDGGAAGGSGTASGGGTAGAAAAGGGEASEGGAGGGEPSGSEPSGDEGDAYQPWLRLRSRVRGDEATDDVAVRMG